MPSVRVRTALSIAFGCLSRGLGLLVCVATLGASAVHAADPTTVGLSRSPSSIGAPAPPAIKVDDSYPSEFELLVSYSLSGGVYQSLSIDLALPPWVTVTLSSHETSTFTFNDCPLVADVGSGRTCRWTATNLAVDNTGVAGTINVRARLDRWRWQENQPVLMSAGATGTFTPSGGAATTFTKNPRATYAGTADANQQVIWQTGHGFASAGWIERLIPDADGAVENGYQLRWGTRFANHAEGSAPLRDLVAITTVGAAIEVLPGFTMEAPWTNNPVTLPPNVDGSVDVVFFYNADAPLESYSDSHFDSPQYYLNMFMPCDSLEPPTQGMLNNNDFRIDTQLTWGERFWGVAQDEIRHFGSATYVVHDKECGEGGSLVKWNENWWPAPEDGFALTGIYMQAPVGVARATNVLVVDDLPNGVAVKSFHTRPPPQFTVYGCNFELLAAAGDISLSYFLAHVVANCEVLAGYAVTPPKVYTHMIAYAPLWGGPEPLQNFRLRYENYIPIGYLTSNLVLSYNDVYLQAVWHLGEQATTVEPDPLKIMADDPWKAQAEVRVLEGNGSCPVTAALIDSAAIASPRATPPGNQLIARFLPLVDRGSAGLNNPVFTIAATSPRVRILSAVAIPTNAAGCGDHTLVIESHPFPTRDPVVFRWTGVQRDTHCTTIIVTLSLDPDGWTNNETFTLVGTLTGVNARVIPACAGRGASTFSVSVPAELRVDVAPSCRGNGGDPAFAVTARNNGGINFSGVQMRFPVPANTTLTGVTADVGVALQCELSGGALVTCPPDPSAAVAVVGSGFSLLAPNESKTMHVRLATGLGLGNSITGSATANALGLGATASSGESVPFAVDDCRYEIAVTKVFDGDNNGPTPRDAPLPNWAFTISSAGGSTTTTATTDNNGVARFYVRTGTYQVTEVVPAVLGGVVWQAYEGTLTKTVVLAPDPEGPVAVTFANHCTCAVQACEVATSACTINGCSYVDEPDCTDAPVYHVTVRTATGTAVVACRLDKTNAPPILDCDPPEQSLPSTCGGIR